MFKLSTNTKRYVLAILFLFIILIVWGYFNIWRSPKYILETNTCTTFEAVLPMARYGEFADSHERPFIFKNENLLVFGSEHTKDPEDSQLTLMEKLYHEFEPTVVLVEGRLGFFIPYVMNPVERFGEMGKAAQLAKQNDADLYIWDSPKQEQLDRLKEKFSPEQIALKEILNPYFGNLRFGKPESPENYVENYLNRAEWLGVQDNISSIQDIDRIWKRDFPEEKDWRETSDQWGLPGYLSAIAEYTNDIRNQHLVCAIQNLMDQGERVFVVCGSSHAFCVKSQFIKDQIHENNPELSEIYNNDQADRKTNSINWDEVSKRDSLRRVRVRQLLDSNLVRTSMDFQNAAMVFQHGRDTTDYGMAVKLMKKSIELDPTADKWLLAAATDRYLLSKEKLQIYGTQYNKMGDGPWKLADMDSTQVTDEERIEFGVRTLAQQREQVKKMNRKNK